MDMVMSKLETIGNTKIGSHTISQHSWLFMDILGLMMGVTSLSTDVYLPAMPAMVAWRVFQAFGACVAPMLSRAMIRDLFDRTEAASMLSTLTMIMAVVPILGPLVGGQIMVISSWHGIFWFMVALGVLLMVSVVFLPETHAAEKRATGSLMNTYKNYWILLKNTSFMKYTLCVTFFYVALVWFNIGGMMTIVFGVLVFFSSNGIIRYHRSRNKCDCLR